MNDEGPSRVEPTYLLYDLTKITAGRLETFRAYLKSLVAVAGLNLLSESFVAVRNLFAMEEERR